MNLHLMPRLLVLLLLATARCSAEDIRGSLPDAAIRAIDSAVDDQMAEQQLTGVAVGILRDGRLQFTKGYGLADLAESKSVTSDTVFNWASNSKPVVAIIAMQLVAEGCLDLDADIRVYLPEFPEKSHPVTPRHLMSHQSGMPHYTNGRIIPAEDYLAGESDHDPVVALGRFSLSPLIFEPGERYSYSSYAYVLLSAVVQRAGGAPFRQLVEERIVAPLRLTSFEWDVATAGQPHWSRGYFRTPVGVVLPAPEEAHYWKHGAGGFKSNIVDFGRWAEALLNEHLLDELSWNAMRTTPPPRDGSSPTMALGINVSGDGESLKLWHGGSQTEARSLMEVYPHAGTGLVVLTNSGHARVDRVAAAIRDVVTNGGDVAP